MSVTSRSKVLGGVQDVFSNGMIYIDPANLNYVFVIDTIGYKVYRVRFENATSPKVSDIYLLKKVNPERK